MAVQIHHLPFLFPSSLFPSPLPVPFSQLFLTNTYLLSEMLGQKVMAGGGTSPPLPPTLFTIFTALLGIAGEDEYHAGREGGLEKIWDGRVKEVGERSKGGLVSQVNQVRKNQVCIRPVRKRGGKGDKKKLTVIS